MQNNVLYSVGDIVKCIKTTDKFYKNSGLGITKGTMLEVKGLGLWTSKNSYLDYKGEKYMVVYFSQQPVSVGFDPIHFVRATPEEARKYNKIKTAKKFKLL